MALPRQPKDVGQPKTIQEGGGGVASGDRLPEIYQKLGGIEQSVTYLEARSTESDRKIDNLSISIGLLTKEVGEAKAVFAALQPIVTGIGKALWAIAGGMIIFLFGILSMWLKHKMGW